MIARNTITIIMIQTAMTLSTNTSIADIGTPAGAVEVPPSCRFAFAICESAGGETSLESGAAGEVFVVEGWVVEVPVVEVPALEVPVAEGWGPIKKVSVDDGDWEPEGIELEEDWLSAVPETAGAAVEAAEAVEAEGRGAPVAIK
jgi:hypothetical protein